MSTGAAFPRARFRRVIVVCAICLIASGAVLAAQEAGGRILGSVQDSTGVPASGASIVVRGPAERHLRTGEDGRFAVELLPQGEYTITATLAGFASSTRSVEIVSGATATVALILVPEVLAQVTVTADRTGERELQKIPLAVSVLTAAQLTQREVHTVADLAGLAPGFTVSQNTGFSQLTIRGIGSTAAFAGSDPSSAVYIDGVYIARPASVLTQFLDSTVSKFCVARRGRCTGTMPWAAH
jgi:Carboxypeptidase regulatory-like domain/TonB-dependent Receptor Plug Domain